MYFSRVSCCSEEEVTRCSAKELADQPLEVVVDDDDDDDDDGHDDDGRGQDDDYDLEKIDTQSSIDTPLQLSADKEISGCSDFVESDFDSKVSNRLYFFPFAIHANMLGAKETFGSFWRPLI